MKKSTHSREYDLLRTELARFRAAANLSQRALAARLGVPHSWVAKVESGERRIDVIELCWVLTACDVPAPDALKGIGARLVELQTKRLKAGRRTS
jgi:transcriptional regulator with XRE-family HTH domain